MTAPEVTQTVPVDGDENAPQSCGEPLALLASDFGRLYAVVHRYLVHRLFDAELAEELTAATFFKAATASRQIPKDPRHMQWWLLRTATNLANTHHRKNRRQRLLLRRFPYTRPMATEPRVDADTGQGQDPARVRAALMTLRPKYQAVVVMRYYSQLSIQEIAEVLRCRRDAVRTRLSRAMKDLRQRLGHLRLEQDTS
jgi:RNA polymerase sigma factor (sigma-70 family)